MPQTAALAICAVKAAQAQDLAAMLERAAALEAFETEAIRGQLSGALSMTGPEQVSCSPIGIVIKAAQAFVLNPTPAAELGRPFLRRQRTSKIREASH